MMFLNDVVVLLQVPDEQIAVHTVEGLRLPLRLLLSRLTRGSVGGSPRMRSKTSGLSCAGYFRHAGYRA